MATADRYRPLARFSVVAALCHLLTSSAWCQDLPPRPNWRASGSGVHAPVDIRHRVKVCPVCEGNGVLCNGIHKVGLQAPYVWQVYPCDHCNLMGYVPRSQFLPRDAAGNFMEWNLRSLRKPSGAVLPAACHTGTNESDRRRVTEQAGNVFGCHSCARLKNTDPTRPDTKDDAPVSPSGNFTPDHVLPSSIMQALSLPPFHQFFAPHCGDCYRFQGPMVRKIRDRILGWRWPTPPFSGAGPRTFSACTRDPGFPLNLTVAGIKAHHYPAAYPMGAVPHAQWASECGNHGTDLSVMIPPGNAR